MTKKDSLFIKGIAVLLLLFHHNPNGYNTYVVPRESARILVWMFLFVTAYGFSSQLEKGYEKHPIRFVLRRLALIYFPMWIMYLLNLGALLYCNRPSIIDYFSQSVWYVILDVLSLSHYFGVSGVAGYWYIGMLFVMTAVFPLLYYGVKKFGWFMILPIYIFTVFDPYRLYSPNGRFFDSYLLIVVIGIIFQQKRVLSFVQRIDKWYRYVGVVFTFIVLLALACFRFEISGMLYTEKYLISDPLSTVMALIVVITVVAFRKDNFISSSIEWLGGQSGNVFYVHGFFYNVILMNSSIYNHWLGFILCLAFSLAISCSVELIKKKLKYNDRLREWLDKTVGLEPGLKSKTITTSSS